MALRPTTNYSEDFDGSWYLDTFYSKVEGCEEEGDFLAFMLNALHEVFSTGNITAKILFDVGTGPTIHSVISACPYVQEIYLSDVAESNRNILQDWCDGKQQHGRELCKFVLGLESDMSKQTVDDRFTQIRQKVKAILPIDVTKNPPIYVDDKLTVDLIISSLCFEAACQSVEEYNKIVQHVSSLLTSGGHLVLVGVLEESFYRVGNFRFDCLKINKTDLQHAYMSQGFEIKTWKEFIPPPRNEVEAEFSDFQKAFVMHAVKK